MACIAMDYIVMAGAVEDGKTRTLLAFMVIACIVMADIVAACVVMARIAMDYIVMAGAVDDETREPSAT